MRVSVTFLTKIINHKNQNLIRVEKPSWCKQTITIIISDSDSNLLYLVISFVSVYLRGFR